MNKVSIVSDPTVLTGKPIVAGTRITVELILEKLASGESIDELLEAHPRLSQEAILAAIDFAARAIRADVIYRSRINRSKSIAVSPNANRSSRWAVFVRVL
jgi:uncharacterized protein (DUF433 family)